MAAAFFDKLGDYFGMGWQFLLDQADHLNASQWFMLMIVIILLGALCLKGFGSRSNY